MQTEREELDRLIASWGGDYASSKTTVFDVGPHSRYLWPHSYNANGKDNVALPLRVRRYKGGFGYAWVESEDVNLFAHPPRAFSSLPKEEKWNPEGYITITKGMVEGLRTKFSNGSMRWGEDIINLAKDLYAANNRPNPKPKPLMRGLINTAILNWQWEIFIEYVFRTNSGTPSHKVLEELKRRAYLILEKPDITRSEVGFYSTPEWRELRVEVLEIYGCSCMMCGQSPKDHGVVIHVDHIKPVSRHPQLALTFSNMQILCADCNIGKSNHYSTDWRPEDAIQE